MITPPELVKNVASGRCVLIVGAGLSKHTRELPLWTEFGHMIRDEIPHSDADDTTNQNIDDYLLEYLEFAKDWYHPQYQAAISKSLESGQDSNSRAHELIATLPWRAVITTNLDTLLEESFRKSRKEPIVVTEEQDIPRIRELRETLILKMHGSVNSKERVLTFGEYHDFDMRRHAMKALLLSYLVRYPAVIVGAGLRDPNFLKLYSIVHSSFNGFQHTAFYVGQGIPRFVQEIWRKRKFSFIDVPHDGLTTWLELLCEQVEKVNQLRFEEHAAFHVNKYLKQRRLIELGAKLSDYAALQSAYTDSVQMPDYGWFKDEWDETLYSPLRRAVATAVTVLYKGNTRLKFLYCAPGPHAPALSSTESLSTMKLLREVVLADIDELTVTSAMEGITRVSAEHKRLAYRAQATDFTGGQGQKLCNILDSVFQEGHPDNFLATLSENIRAFENDTLGADRDALVSVIAEGLLPIKERGDPFDITYSEMVAAFTATAVYMGFRSKLFMKFNFLSVSDPFFNKALDAVAELWRKFNDYIYKVHVESLAAVTRSGGTVLVSVDTHKIFDSGNPNGTCSFEGGPYLDGFKGIRLIPTLTREDLMWRDHAYGLDICIAGHAILDFKPHKHKVALYAFRRD